MTRGRHPQRNSTSDGWISERRNLSEANDTSQWSLPSIRDILGPQQKDTEDDRYHHFQSASFQPPLPHFDISISLGTNLSTGTRRQYPDHLAHGAHQASHFTDSPLSSAMTESDVSEDHTLSPVDCFPPSRFGSPSRDKKRRSSSAQQTKIKPPPINQVKTDCERTRRDKQGTYFAEIEDRLLRRGWVGRKRLNNNNLKNQNEQRRGCVFNYPKEELLAGIVKHLDTLEQRDEQARAQVETLLTHLYHNLDIPPQIVAEIRNLQEIVGEPVHDNDAQETLTEE